MRGVDRTLEKAFKDMGEGSTKIGKELIDYAKAYSGQKYVYGDQKYPDPNPKSGGGTGETFGGFWDALLGALTQPKPAKGGGGISPIVINLPTSPSQAPDDSSDGFTDEASAMVTAAAAKLGSYIGADRILKGAGNIFSAKNVRAAKAAAYRFGGRKALRTAGKLGGAFLGWPVRATIGLASAAYPYLKRAANDYGKKLQAEAKAHGETLWGSSLNSEAKRAAYKAAAQKRYSAAMSAQRWLAKQPAKGPQYRGNAPLGMTSRGALPSIGGTPRGGRARGRAAAATSSSAPRGGAPWQPDEILVQVAKRAPVPWSPYPSWLSQRTKDRITGLLAKLPAQVRRRKSSRATPQVEIRGDISGGGNVAKERRYVRLSRTPRRKKKRAKRKSARVRKGNSLTALWARGR